MEHHLFEKIDPIRVIICRQCKHAVWPGEVKRHLTGKKHRLRQAEARSIHEAIEHWDGLEHDHDQLTVPNIIDEPISGLEIYPDGLLCEREPLQCQYIARSLDVMKRHWREEHNWTLPRGGRPSERQRQSTAVAILAGFRTVACQRLFPSRHGSQYIQIQSPEIPTAVEGRAANHTDAVSQLISLAKGQYQQTQQGISNITRTAELDEANPWLRRTRWADYLKGLDRNRLFTSIREPEEETNEPNEARARVIWEAMEGLIRHSQIIVSRTGHQLRLEAIRTEKHQNQHRPLESYMDPETIVKHMRPWQQVMMFFARTQINHDWESPGYGFTPRQRQTWQALWRLARSQVRDQGQTADADQRQEVAPDETSHQLSPIQVACLEACIELLNQSARVHEYECALVCALSVLGIRESEGWRDTEDYPQILSRMIKIARFMVVVKAIRLDPNGYDCVTCLGEQRGREDLPWDGPMAVEDYTFEGSQDAGYESNPGTPTPEPPSPIPTISLLSMSSRHRDANPRDEITGKWRSFREWLRIFMDTFMVRGTHSPMQWMLDLRTCGLKIHYNTTSPRLIADDRRQEPMLLAGIGDYADGASVDETEDAGSARPFDSTTIPGHLATSSAGERVRDALGATVRMARLAAELIGEHVNTNATGAGQWPMASTLAEATLATATAAASGDATQWTAACAQQQAAVTRAIAEIALQYIQAYASGRQSHWQRAAVMAEATVAMATQAEKKVEEAAREGWDGE